MEHLLSSDWIHHMDIDPSKDEDSNQDLTLEEIMSVLDVPTDVLTDIQENQIDVKKDDRDLSEDIEYAGVEKVAFCSPKEEANGKGTETPLSTHIAHGVLNININKMLASQFTWDQKQKQSESNKKLFKECWSEDLSMPTMKVDDTAFTKDDSKIEHTNFLCFICTKPALRYSSYGGRGCSSCRSFFRRSSQNNLYRGYLCNKSQACLIDPNSRKNCQYCRFQACLRSGMKITWVLSDQERERRFKKTDQSIVVAKPRNVLFSSSRKTLIHHSFTIEEQGIVEDIHAKFQNPWLQDFLIFNKDSATNLIKYIYGLSKLNNDTWNNLSDSMHINVIKNVLPKFTELSDLPIDDLREIMNSPNSRIQLFFRGCFVLQMESPKHRKQTKQPLSSQVCTASLCLSPLLYNFCLDEVSCK